MPETPSPLPAPMRRLPVAIGAVVAGVLIAAVGIYGFGPKRPAGDATCAAAVDLAKKIAPLAHGEVAAVTMASAPLRLSHSVPGAGPHVRGGAGHGAAAAAHGPPMSTGPAAHPAAKAAAATAATAAASPRPAKRVRHAVGDRRRDT